MLEMEAGTPATVRAVEEQLIDEDGGGRLEAARLATWASNEELAVKEYDLLRGSGRRERKFEGLRRSNRLNYSVPLEHLVVSREVERSTLLSPRGPHLAFHPRGAGQLE